MTRRKGLRVWQVGLGPIGRRMLKLAAERGCEIIGASDPAYAGDAVSDVIGTEAGCNGCKVTKTGPSEALDLVLHATVSELEPAFQQLVEGVTFADAVISTCEELAWPYYKYPQLSKKLNELAQRNDSRILGTGINPGFAMELFPLVMTGSVQDWSKITVLRHLDASKRRGPLQEKIGAGLSPDEFDKQKEAGDLGHRGLETSIRLLASALDTEIDDISTDVSPVLAERGHETQFVSVEPGHVAGVSHTARAVLQNSHETEIAHELVMAFGVEQSIDRVTIEGKPSFDVEIKGGLPGDECTAAVALNYANVIFAAPPGLHTVDKLPVPHPG